MDSFLFITLLFIFFSAALSVYIRTKIRDRCLSDFEDYRVCLQEKGAGMINGYFRVYAAGIELEYPEPKPNRNGFLETSYIMYKAQFIDIEVIYRYHEFLSKENQRRRKKSIRKSYQPQFFRKRIRTIRNTLNNFKDAILQSIGAVMGQVQKTSSRATLLTSQNKRITDISDGLISVTANAYEPLLEKYIGNHVILEMILDGQEIEYFGILKEYSGEFIELLDIHHYTQISIDVKENTEHSLDNFMLNITRKGKIIRIDNNGPVHCVLKSFRSREQEITINKDVVPYSFYQFHVDAHFVDNTYLDIEVIQQMDIIVPRKHALVRHSGEVKNE